VVAVALARSLVIAATSVVTPAPAIAIVVRHQLQQVRRGR
jgi:hypothetical protein